MQQATPLQTPPSSIQPEKSRTGIALTINAESYTHTGDPNMTLLWYLRDVLHLTGTKYACDDGTCGACSVLVDGKVKRACRMPMDTLQEHTVTTIEGVAAADGALHPLQQAFIDSDAIQCGYCQPGWIIAAVALLQAKPSPSDRDIDRIENLCRCGIQPRMRDAIKLAAKRMREHKS